MSQAINKGKKWTEEEYDYLRNNYHKLGGKAIAKKLGRTMHGARLKASEMGLKRTNIADDESREYALYKGENILQFGTIKEIAKKEGVKPLTIYYYGTEAHLKKMSKSTTGNYKVLIRLDDEED